jgi:hypothetical protein
MQLTLKRGGLLLGMFAALLVTMALASSSASASPFCGGQSVNNQNKCWGAARALSGANAYGNATGVCVGADLTQGTCAPTNQLATVGMPYGQHSPWVIGTASAFTQTWGNTTP